VRVAALFLPKSCISRRSLQFDASRMWVRHSGSPRFSWRVTLEEVPEELVVNIVVILHLGKL
jgi:hypothetical protein